MADVRRAIAKLKKIEGGRANNKFDDGGDTYAGITRTWYPNWAGWTVIDEGAKIGKPVPTDLLDHLVDEFYATVYGVPLRIADPRMPQGIADELLECAVNTTVGRAVTILQRVLNGLNLHGKRWADIDVDGRLGPGTISTLEAAVLKLGTSDRIVFWQNVLQGAYLWERVEKDPDNEEFALGWEKRFELPSPAGGSG